MRIDVGEYAQDSSSASGRRRKTIYVQTRVVLAPGGRSPGDLNRPETGARLLQARVVAWQQIAEQGFAEPGEALHHAAQQSQLRFTRAASPQRPAGWIQTDILVFPGNCRGQERTLVIMYGEAQPRKPQNASAFERTQCVLLLGG